jgi:hypothetical protein
MIQMYHGRLTLKPEFQKIWNEALPYLKGGLRKDFVLHTKGVVRAMGLLLESEEGDPHVLMPAAILHDTGWSRVPANLQKTRNQAESQKGMQLHLTLSIPIIERILKKECFDESRIQTIINIVLAHKFTKPEDMNQELLIDADTIADVFKDQFYSDCAAYNIIPEQLYEIRKKNRFFTDTAREIFRRKLSKRKIELGLN